MGYTKSEKALYNRFYYQLKKGKKLDEISTIIKDKKPKVPFYKELVNKKNKTKKLYIT